MPWKGSISTLYLCAAILVFGLVACTAGGPADDSSAPAAGQSTSEKRDSAKDAPDEAPLAAKPSDPSPEPEVVEVTVPAGTIFELELLSPLDTSLSQVGDEIQAHTIAPLYLGGKPVLPQGTYVEGHVTEVQASGRVKGRSKIAFTFDGLKTSGGMKAIQTSYVGQEAKSGKKKDAAVIGGGAGVGALVGGIIGGKKGAAIGAAVGGAGGTGVVLATKGEEIKLPVGTEVNVRLDSEIVLQLH